MSVLGYTLLVTSALALGVGGLAAAFSGDTLTRRQVWWAVSAAAAMVLGSILVDLSPSRAERIAAERQAERDCQCNPEAEARR